MSCCPNADSPGYQKGPSTLPFNVEYGTPNNPTQAVCNNNMCLLPNGPIIPTRPMFPSALPSDFTPSTTNVQTNYLTVKKLGCICNLRASCLLVDDGARNTGTTSVVFQNLPAVSGNFSYLVIDSQGRVHTQDSSLVSKQMKSLARGNIRRPVFGNFDGEDENPFNLNENQYMPNFNQPFGQPLNQGVPHADNMLPHNFTGGGCGSGMCGGNQ